MGIPQIEDSKVLRAYCAKLGRKGVAERIIEIAKEIVKGDGAYITTLENAGRIRALAIGAKCDTYWDEKQSKGFSDMVWEAKAATKEVKEPEEKRKFLTVEQAIELLPEGDEIHTFLDGGRILVGADWSRESVLKLINEAESCEIGGPACMDMGHGLVVLRKGGKKHDDYVFVKHDEKAIKKYL